MLHSLPFAHGSPLGNPPQPRRRPYPGIPDMASALTDKLSRLVKEMRGQARITESNVQDMLREVRMALLEADVALPVVRDFIARVKEKALGQDVLGLPQTRADAGQHRQPRAGRHHGRGRVRHQPGRPAPAVILMAGLQGAGKTTTTAKLAPDHQAQEKGADRLRRRVPPAAIEQLKTVTAQAGAEWFPEHARPEAARHRAGRAGLRQEALL